MSILFPITSLFDLWFFTVIIIRLFQLMQRPARNEPLLSLSCRFNYPSFDITCQSSFSVTKFNAYSFIIFISEIGRKEEPKLCGVYTRRGRSDFPTFFLPLYLIVIAFHFHPLFQPHFIKLPNQIMSRNKFVAFHALPM